MAHDSLLIRSMNRSKGLVPRGGANGYPAPDPYRGPSQDPFHRRKQINTLRIFNENVSEIRPDVQYHVDFRAVNGQAFQLRVFLPPGFPSQRPDMALSPPGSHPWLDQSGQVVGAPGLLNYSVLSDLGRVVQAIKRELEKNPPKVSTSGPESKTSPEQPLGAVSRVSRPTPVISVIPGLSDLSPEELTELSESDIALRHFCQTMPNPDLDALNLTLEQTRERIQTLAHDNQNLGQSLQDQKDRISEAIQPWSKVRDELSAALPECAASRQKVNLPTLVERLAQASVQSEEDSEAMAEKFQAGDMSVETFMKEFVASRSAYHLRRTKLDKLRTYCRSAKN
ncbi:hypothetical protein TCAL_08190 [Tigriopus californicus]|uniref:VPS37 C-terminal domain-containing protein n=1 Tax=Tigriopus californicus TaxID=6832 RepID=A0A553NDQ8_TIGCA|nr:vacuolar protein sorting-associated protein 37A-like [Tigriopus californicus]TRY63584.1 hypothetical protein TCAL_08190 [Tigriopus californicus]|eukprot:TCALIF_08190-PA protein Name:"Similar to VPS37A Vacuolar protein sorting-associated protein 37A (Homo sapiens)" AED:0.06 eAED:0.06 QI:0/-1/0/1/-1/1/1/0/338